MAFDLIKSMANPIFGLSNHRLITGVFGFNSMGVIKKIGIIYFLALGGPTMLSFGSINTDSLFVKIHDAYFVGQYVEIPVSFSAQGPVFSLDLAFRFDFNRLQFDNLTGIYPGLQYLFYLNPLDSIWRLTSFHPSGLAPNAPVFNLRFFTSNNEACAYDFSDQEGFLNGDSCYSQVNGCLNNTGIEEANEMDDISFFPNPFFNELNITAPVGASVHVYRANGQLVESSVGPAYVNTIRWPDGLYFIHVVHHAKVRVFKLLKCQ
jgi:hypothetical protein